MNKYSGLLKIARFNWPWYAAAVVTTAAGILLLQSGALVRPWSLIGVVSIFGVNFWMVASLGVSHYVYDRSGISRGKWLDSVTPTSVQRAAIFHAGQNEASEAVARVLPSVKIQIFDFYDPERNGSPSLERARALTDSHDVAIVHDRIPLNDAVLDLGLIVFAAHEIRRKGERVAFFRELGRALAPGGRLIIVEHLRNGWNFLAYGPGAFHFFSRTTWCRSFSNAGLELVSEESCTPFVRVFELGKGP